MAPEEIEKTRIQLAGLALQGMIEREESCTSKLISDFMYEKMSKHCVKLADAVLKELISNEFHK